MDANTIFMQLQGMSGNYTLDHARIMEAYGRDRGLTPFAEFSPMLFFNKSTQKYQISFKDHYSMVQRWAQDRGGYRRTWKRLQAPAGDVRVEVEVISNRDYAIVLQACQYGADRKEEMEAYTHRAEGICTAKDYNDKRNTGKSQEWFALKRATEAALIETFGKEPAQARQIYGVSMLTTENKQTAVNALYPAQSREALPAPAPVIDGDYTDFDPDADYEALQQVIAGEVARYAEQAEEHPEPGASFIVAVEFGPCDVKGGGKPHIGFMAEGEKWPSVKWWKGRDALLEAAPWIGAIATKEELADIGRRFNCQMRVYYEMNGTYKNAVRFEQITEAQA